MKKERQTLTGRCSKSINQKIVIAMFRQGRTRNDNGILMWATLRKDLTPN